MKKHAARKLVLTRETLRRLDTSILARVPGAADNQTPAQNPAPAVPLPLNSVNGTSCLLCSDYVYCGPSADPCDKQ